MELNFIKKEEETLKFWKEKKVFEKSISQRKNAKDFVFYEGPPTANGRPGIHHVLNRAFKDVICRYKTMQGFRVLRKAGWDTHGLPVELEIEKKLGLKNKKDIEKYGIAEFNKQCKDSVLVYKSEWEKLTDRIGYWLDMKNPYVTYENNYIETLWWVIKQIWQKGLLYKGHKVVPYCPRCGTSLSSHEVAQGYQKIKEPSIYFKLQITSRKLQNTYLLVWTTTPWTLPANVAVAVNPKLAYVKVKLGDEFLILAKERIEAVGATGEIVEEFSGKDLLGLKYNPLFDMRPQLGQSKAYFVVAGDFVSLKEGTGLVHIAPAFGEDDMNVGKANELPVLMTVDETGSFKPEVEQWAGMFVKDADPLIIKDLEDSGVIFREELYEHDYPFCWRCKSPLLYYAKESWFINMQKVKKDLMENNQKINWVPSHLKEGRFGEWLKDLKDWAFSRERYWGTPLPVWQCGKCGHKEVIGSREDLLGQKFSTNRYYIMRHGQNHHQVNDGGRIYPWPEKKPILLSEKGKKEVSKSAKELKEKQVDIIYFSDMNRTRQTAEFVNKELGAEIIANERLRDMNFGVYHGRDKAEYYRDFPRTADGFYGKKPEGGENWGDVRRRMADFIRDIDKKHKNKTILLVSHCDPLWLLEGFCKGMTDSQLLKIKLNQKDIKTGEWRKLDFKDAPFDKEGKLDFHRPYIDEVRFICPKCEALAERVKEVVDVWFDSGCMPFAQHHYPFEKNNFQFPADYISEAIDQTRGWFYTLLAVSTLLGKGTPYKNVISTSHVLDEKGDKMSKSKGNVVDPWYIIDKYGADATRWYFYTINQPGDSKLFVEKDIDQTLKKFILILWNCFTFYKTYQDGKKVVRRSTSNNILDKWIVSRLNELILGVTEKLDKYDVTGAARDIEGFVIGDLSLWYIRRSRKRFEEAESTLVLVFQTISKLSAPFIPFLSEAIYENVSRRDEKRSRSVHLAGWPKADRKLVNKNLNQKMAKVREIVTLALAERAKAGIKVRQPLASLLIPAKIDKELAELIKEEVNVKKIIFSNTLVLDTKITPELREEGIVRELIRQINEMRKELGLTSKDAISIQYSGDTELINVLEKNKKVILSETKAKDLKHGEGIKEIKIDQRNLQLGIRKL